MVVDQKGIFVIGDSISLDYGPHLEAALPESISYSRKEGNEEAYQNLDVPRGANGGDSLRVKEYLSYLKAGGVFHCDLLLLNCGLHDIKSDPNSGELRVSPEQYRANLHEIVSTCEALSDQLLWMRITPVDDERHAQRGCGFNRVQKDVDLYNTIADEVMTERGIPILALDEFTLQQGLEQDLYRDGVHFLKPIHKLQGDYIAQQVTSYLSA